MHNYKINLKLHTLAECDPWPDAAQNSFCLNNVNFEHWDYSPIYGHRSNAWLVSTTIEAKNFDEVEKLFAKSMHDLIPKIALISQCYTEYLNQSFLIHREGHNVACFRFSRNCKEVGLRFASEQVKALEKLSNNTHEIPDEFFYYWNDMVNTVGYSAKLLLLCAAIEALTNKKNKEALKEKILGKELKDKLFQKRGRGAIGTRHRLSHGQYFLKEGGEENYLEEAYKKIIIYLNKIFGEELIIENVRDPQRHFFGNYDGYHSFIRKIGDTDKCNFDFKKLMTVCEKKSIVSSREYEFLTSDEIPSDY